MKPLTILFLLFAVCSTFASPIEENTSALQKSPLETLTNPELLVQKLVNNLRAAAKDSQNAISSFEDSFNNQAKNIREKSALDLLTLKARISNAVVTVLQKVTDSATAVQNCVNSQSTAAETVFNNTLSNAVNCTYQGLEEFASLVQNLGSISSEALSFADSVLLAMQGCITTYPGNILGTSICLSNLVLNAEATGILFITTSAIEIGRLNLAIASITSAMEVCVASQLVYAAIATGEIVLQIGTCSALSVFTVVVSNT